MKSGKTQALIFGLIALVISQLIAWWHQSTSPLLAAILTVAAGSIPLFVEYTKAHEPATANAHSGDMDRPGRQGVRPPKFRGGGLVVGLMLLIIVGGGIAWGASYLFGWVTGIEPATQRLAAPVTGKAGALTVRVDEVGVGNHTTQLLVTATNGADFGVTVPMFSNCRLLERGHPPLEAQTGFTSSELDVPPEAEPVTQRLVFAGTPSAAKPTLVLSCSTLFWQGFGQPSSLQVKGIRLNAAP